MSMPLDIIVVSVMLVVFVALWVLLLTRSTWDYSLDTSGDNLRVCWAFWGIPFYRYTFTVPIKQIIDVKTCDISMPRLIMLFIQIHFWPFLRLAGNLQRPQMYELHVVGNFLSIKMHSRYLLNMAIDKGILARLRARHNTP